MFFSASWPGWLEPLDGGRLLMEFRIADTDSRVMIESGPLLIYQSKDGVLTPTATVRVFRTVQSERKFGKFRGLDKRRFESDFDHMVKRPPRKKPQ